MELLARLFLGEPVADVVFSALPDVEQQTVNTFAQRFVVGVTQFNPAGTAGGVAVCVKRLELSVFIEPLHTGVLENPVEIDYLRHVGLAVVAHHNEIGVFKVAVSTDALHQNAQLAVVLFQLELGRIAVDAKLVPHGVQIAHLDKHHVRLTVIADDIRRNRVGEVIQTAVEHLVAAAKHVSVFPEITIEHLRAGNAFVKLARIVAAIAHRHAHRQVDIHIRPGGDRPVHQTGGKPPLLGVFSEEFLLNQLAADVPRHRMHAGLHLFVVRNAMLLRVASRHN